MAASAHALVQRRQECRIGCGVAGNAVDWVQSGAGMRRGPACRQQQEPPEQQPTWVSTDWVSASSLVHWAAGQRHNISKQRPISKTAAAHLGQHRLDQRLLAHGQLAHVVAVALQVLEHAVDGAKHLRAVEGTGAG